VSDIDTATVDNLKALDPNRPIREADILSVRGSWLLQLQIILFVIDDTAKSDD
jgi:hypothetical protein